MPNTFKQQFTKSMHNYAKGHAKYKTITESS